MVWVTRDESDKPIIKEISEQTDRGAALIAAAYLEERLTDAIKARLVRDPDIEGRLFKGTGPIAAFSTKIDLAFQLGIYENDIRRLLHTVRNIRNGFAHRPEPLKFDSQRIHDLCMNINIGVQTEMDITDPDGTVNHLSFDVQPDGTARTAFFNTVRFLLLILDMEINIAPPRVPAPPVFQSLAKPFLASNEISPEPQPRTD